jgi:hypothetical protein
MNKRVMVAQVYVLEDDFEQRDFLASRDFIPEAAAINYHPRITWLVENTNPIEWHVWFVGCVQATLEHVYRIRVTLDEHDLVLAKIAGKVGSEE